MQLHGSQLPKGQTGAEKNEKGGFRAALFYSVVCWTPPFSFCAQTAERRPQGVGRWQPAGEAQPCPLPVCAPAAFHDLRSSLWSLLDFDQRLELAPQPRGRDLELLERPRRSSL